MHFRSLAWSTNPATTSAAIATVLPGQARVEPGRAVSPAGRARNPPQPQPPGFPPPIPAVHRPPAGAAGALQGQRHRHQNSPTAPVLSRRTLLECSTLGILAD